MLVDSEAVHQYPRAMVAVVNAIPYEPDTWLRG